MGIKLKTCPVCGRTFQAKNARAIYCSGKCKSRAYRRNGRSEPIRDPEETEDQKEEQRKRDLKLQGEKRLNELGAAARRGDGIAMMRVARPFSVEFFQGLQRYELEFSEQSGRASTVSVNGVDINDPDFPESAAYAVKEDGVYILRR